MQAVTSIWNRARAKAPRVVVPESRDERILRAAVKSRDEGLARPILVGDVEDVRDSARRLGVDIGDCLPCERHCGHCRPEGRLMSTPRKRAHEPEV